jgi:hypothetical protein
VESVRSSSALDRATPKGLWTWAVIIALVGVAARVIWFMQFEHDLPFAYGETLSGHAWALEPSFRAATAPGAAFNSYDVTRAFAPGYGALLHGIVAAAGPGASLHSIGVSLLAVQSVFAAFATLITFALSRRVLFGKAALIPPLLVTASIALIELPGGLAPSIPLMLLLTLAIWQLTLLSEKLPDARGPKIVLLTISAGFMIGAATLFNPAVLLVAPFILWWAFRGLGTDHAVLLLVATLLLPACWLAVAQTQLPGGIPIEQAKAWIEQDAGNVASSANDAVNRAYNYATPWNARFARGSYASSNWNYEWILPLSVRTDTTYQVATRGGAALLMVAYLVLVLMGLIELFAEGAGSAARLLAFPVIALPFATLLSPLGGLLRVPILPFLMIALTLGLVWIGENLKPHTRDRRAKSRESWT